MNIKKYDIVNYNKLRVFISSLIIIGIMFLQGCWKSDSKDRGLKVINVLDKSYFDDAHIKGSVHIPFEDLESHMKNMNKDIHYVFYCSNYACMAAPTAAKMMQKAGFKKVSVYPGGIVEWYQKKYPYTGEAKLEYLHEENEPLGDDDHDNGVSIIKADTLLGEMKQAGLLS